jgi:integration host factor subunit beta
MLKRDVVRRLAELHPQLGLHGAEKAYQAITQRICQALQDGDRVELRDFGAFSAIARSSRQARNPRTGTAIEVAGKLFVQFRTGRSIRKRLNAGKS